MTHAKLGLGAAALILAIIVSALAASPAKACATTALELVARAWHLLHARVATWALAYGRRHGSHLGTDTSNRALRERFVILARVTAVGAAAAGRRTAPAPLAV